MAHTETIERIESVESTQVQEPKLYKVLLHNDDKTTFDFVIAVLMEIFHRTYEDAFELTNMIHVQGKGVAGAPYTKEVAEEKVEETTNFARYHNFPLTATIEEI